MPLALVRTRLWMSGPQLGRRGRGRSTDHAPICQSADLCGAKSARSHGTSGSTTWPPTSTTRMAGSAALPMAVLPNFERSSLFPLTSTAGQRTASRQQRKEERRKHDQLNQRRRGRVAQFARERRVGVDAGSSTTTTTTGTTGETRI
ncbi:unnamed protein product [Ectocarpus sp. 13 AM-2016]